MGANVVLGWDFWGLLLLAIAALLELRVSNPHHPHRSAPRLVDSTWSEYDWLAAWAHSHDFSFRGWEAAAYLEAIGMSLLILAEIFEHMAVHHHSMTHTVLTVLFRPPVDPVASPISGKNSGAKSLWTPERRRLALQ